MPHLIGLRCPDCGHTWPGHAQPGVSWAICPRCPESRLEGSRIVHAAAGEPYEGSRPVPGCDRHSSPLPCPHCPKE